MFGIFLFNLHVQSTLPCLKSSWNSCAHSPVSLNPPALPPRRLCCRIVSLQSDHAATTPRPGTAIIANPKTVLQGPTRLTSCRLKHCHAMDARRFYFAAQHRIAIILIYHPFLIPLRGFFGCTYCIFM